MGTFSDVGCRQAAGNPVWSRVKSALRTIRVSQPFNYLATSTVHAMFGATGLHSELVIKHLHRVGFVQRNLPNGRTLRLWSRSDDWVSNQVYWRGWSGYEPETAPLFFRLATRARVAFDVGAYVGLFTLLAAHANPDGQVFAFEPLPNAYERLEKNVSLNRLTNVRCVSAAVGKSDGTAEFFCGATHIPCSSSLSFEFMRTADELSSLTVPVITLDRFVQEAGLDIVDLVKIDTESTEPEVLSGMIETLRRSRPNIICEVLKGRGAEELLGEILRPLGYRYYLLTPDGPELRDQIEGHTEWLNYLFTTLGPDDVVRL